VTPDLSEQAREISFRSRPRGGQPEFQVPVRADFLMMQILDAKPRRTVTQGELEVSGLADRGVERIRWELNQHRSGDEGGDHGENAEADGDG
jgi:hypothetical protein